MSTTTLTLTDFVLARVDEDEQLARYALTRPDWPMDWAGQWFGHVTHYERWEPERVLALCEAHRAIVKSQGGATYAVRCLAAAYASHPDYRSAWKP